MKMLIYETIETILSINNEKEKYKPIILGDRKEFLD